MDTPAVAMENLDERMRKVLFAIVRHEISTGEPVGSRALCREIDLDLSSATIRGVMADLTEQGYLLQSHVSAGRTPSEHAYRLYVNSLDTLELTDDVRQLIKNTIGDGGLALNEVLRDAPRLLADLTDGVGMITTPRTGTRLRKLEFVPMDAERIYVVLIADCNMVYQSLVRVSRPMDEEILRRVSMHLNEQFASQELKEASEQVWDILAEEREEYPELFAQVARISKRALSLPSQRELFVDGRHNLMRVFNDVEMLRELILMLEKKSPLIELLDEMFMADFFQGVQVTIGSENPPSLSQCAMVVATYEDGHENLGALGVLGPANMNYEKIIPVIDYTARCLSSAVSA